MAFMDGLRRESAERSRARLVAWLAWGCALGLLGCASESQRPDRHRPGDASTDRALADAVSEAPEAEAGDADLEGGEDAAWDVGGVDAAPDTAAAVDADAEPTGSCDNATLADVPAVGEAMALTVDVSDAQAELKGSCGGYGRERVIALAPTEDAAILVTVGGTGSFDPVVYVRADGCSASQGMVEVACQAGGPGTQLLVQVEANRDYFVVVDTAGPSTSTTAQLTLLRLS